MADALLEAQADEDEAQGYSWEQGMERSWEQVMEDDQGNLLDAPKRRDQRRRRASQAALAGTVRRGMIRYVALVLDCSGAMRATDMAPSRLAVVRDAAVAFVNEFYGQNPISHLGVFAMSDGRVAKLTRLTGSPKSHISAIQNNLPAPSGDASLQNALDMAHLSLKSVPEYASREVVILTGALSTRDPGDIHASVDALRADRVIVSVVGLAAEMFVCRNIAERTGGSAAVARNAPHVLPLVLELTTPRPTPADAPKACSMVQMGFPTQRVDPLAALCACHRRFQARGFTCPRCRSKACEIPSTCATCALPLVSSPHLARSYHHLFPIAVFKELAQGPPASCDSCRVHLGPDALRYECPACAHHFCAECDLYIHDSLHNCPGC